MVGLLNHSGQAIPAPIAHCRHRGLTHLRVRGLANATVAARWHMLPLVLLRTVNMGEIA
jgi:hypothetical protein